MNRPLLPFRFPRDDLSRLRRIGKFFAPFLRTHRRWLLRGGAAAFGVVLIRLAFPWLLAELVEQMLRGGAEDSAGAALLTTGLLVPLFFAVLGGLDMLARQWFGRFAIELVRDVRADGVRAARKHSVGRARKTSGDFLARLVGDTARLKEGLKGFLIHVTTNGLLLFGVVIALLFVHVRLAFIMCVALLLVVAITVVTSMRIWRRARRLRRQEGRMAEAILQAIHSAEPRGPDQLQLHPSSVPQANLTRMQGRATWAVHGVLGLAILLCLWPAVHGPQETQLQVGDLTVLLGYVLILLHPGVRLARQGTRAGKLLACAGRLEQALGRAQRREQRRREKETCREALQPLARELRLADVRLGGRRDEGRNRLGPVDLVLRPGEHLALVGGRGAGKSTLLKLLSRPRQLDAGRILWDGQDLAGIDRRRRAKRIVYVPREPRWQAQRLEEWFGSTSEEIGAALLAIGAAALLPRLSAWLAGPLGSADFSSTERRALATARALRQPVDVVLLDDPFLGCTPTEAEARATALLQTPRALIVSMQRPVALESFDRVVPLENGRLSSLPF